MDYFLAALAGAIVMLFLLAWLHRALERSLSRYEAQRYEVFRVEWRLYMPQHPVPDLSDFRRQEKLRGNYLGLGRWERE